MLEVRTMHDCMDAGGRTASGTAVEEQLSEQLPDEEERPSRKYCSPDVQGCTSAASAGRMRAAFTVYESPMTAFSPQSPVLRPQFIVLIFSRYSLSHVAN